MLGGTERPAHRLGRLDVLLIAGGSHIGRGETVIWLAPTLARSCDLPRQWGIDHFIVNATQNTEGSSPSPGPGFQPRPR